MMALHRKASLKTVFLMRTNLEQCGSGRMANNKEDVPVRKNSQLTELN